MRPAAKTRWCIWHPTDGLVPWSMSILPETRAQFVRRFRDNWRKGTKLRIVRVELRPTGSGRLYKP